MAPAVALESLSAPLIDSHCHLVFRNFDDDLEEVAQRWRDAGVGRLLHACVEPSEIPAIRALADRFPELRYSVGVHPLDPQHWQPDTPEVLRSAAQADARVVAIGELGLDLFRDQNLDQQLAMLRPQLDLAVELDLPVIIHCRDAAEPMLAELRQRAAAAACPRGVMHCWSGTPEEMAGFLELGLYIPRRMPPTPVPVWCRRIAFWWKPTVRSWRRCHVAASAMSPPSWRPWRNGWPSCVSRASQRWPARARPTPAPCSAPLFTVYDVLLAWQRVLVYLCSLQPESVRRDSGGPAPSGAVSFRCESSLSAGLK
jgi:hypothetical protein